MWIIVFVGVWITAIFVIPDRWPGMNPVLGDYMAFGIGLVSFAIYELVLWLVYSHRDGKLIKDTIKRCESGAILRPFETERFRIESEKLLRRLEAEDNDVE